MVGEFSLDAERLIFEVSAELLRGLFMKHYEQFASLPPVPLYRLHSS